jgi:hypothetical protein
MLDRRYPTQSCPRPSEIPEVLVKHSSYEHCIYVQLFHLERKPCLKEVAAAEQ